MAKCWGGCHGQGCIEDGDHPIASYMPRGHDERYFEELAEVDFDDDEMKVGGDDDCCSPRGWKKNECYCSSCNCYFPPLPLRPNFPQALNIFSWNLKPQLGGQIEVRSLQGGRRTVLTTSQEMISTHRVLCLLHEDSRQHKPKEQQVGPIKLDTFQSWVYFEELSTPGVEDQLRTAP